jgi:hypothetical protein
MEREDHLRLPFARVCMEGIFAELRLYGVLGSWDLLWSSWLPTALAGGPERVASSRDGLLLVRTVCRPSPRFY